MTPKEKALELVNKFREQDAKGILFTADFNPKREQKILDKAKSFALIAVDEILQSLGHKKLSDSPYTTLEARQHYVQVKQEIENL
jgi:hypothetical protein